MANKFCVLGHVVSLKEEEFEVNVRRNFKDYSNEYLYDVLTIKTSLGLSPTTFLNLSVGDLIFVSGRVERDALKILNLVAEQITATQELKS